MRYVRLGIPVLALSLLGAAFLQKEKDDKDPPAKPRGFLPAHFKKLGLTDAQKDKIYAAQAKFRARQDELRRQIEKAKNDEREAVEAVLTPAQLKRLKEIRAGEKTPDPTDKEKGGEKKEKDGK